MHKVLIIDDDVALCELLTEYLVNDGFQLTAVHSGHQALDSISQQTYELIILDVMLPRLSGFEVLRQLREHCDIPILMLTARGEEVDRIVGLEMGADDYMPKPCNPRELSARLKAILRRAQKTVTRIDDIIEIDDIKLDEASHSVTRQGKPLALTLAEYRILKALMTHPGKVIKKDTLCQLALERDLEPFDRSIDVHISRLRHKLGPLANGKPRIKTVRGIGYIYQHHHNDRET